MHWQQIGSRIKHFFELFAIISFFVNMFLIPFSRSRILRYKNKATPEEPYLITEDCVYLRDIEEAATDGRHVYEVYGGSNILKIYDMHGNFERAYALFFTGTNGTASLYVDEDCVYVDTTNHIVYSFPDGKFGSVYQTKEEQSLLNCKSLQNRAQHLPDGSIIKISWTSVIHQSADGKRTVLIHNSPLLIFFQHRFFNITIVLWFIIAIKGAFQMSPKVSR